MIKCNTLSIDEGALKSALKPYLLNALKEAEDKLLELLEKEVMRTVHGDGPGKPEWRESTRDALKVIEEIAADSYLKAKVGFDKKGKKTDFIKAMVIAEGAGSAGPSGHCILAGPPGRSVWDGNLDGKHPSNAKTQYMLPSYFNQEGNHFAENATKLMEKHFVDVLSNAMANIPDSVFYSAVIVSAG